MMGPWEVSSNVLGVRTFYSVCRLKDTEEVRHSRNLVYSDRGCTNDLAEAEKYAEKLITPELAAKSEYAHAVLSATRRISPLDESLIPESSLIKEFIPGGIYEQLY